MILYDDIFGFDITVMKEVLQQYGTGDKAWKVFCEFYKDPDGYPINENGLRMKSGVECTVDGLLSVKRIYEHEGFNENFIDTFTIYREVPIIFFPKEQGGINQSRYSGFGDRIDHTLFDLKQYYEKKDCKLSSSYQLKKTQRWIRSFSSFSEMIKWMNVDGIFVDHNNNIFDLEKNDGTIIDHYCKRYHRSWSEHYYKNIKEKIKAFKEKIIVV